MRLEGSYLFENAPRELLWDMFFEPEVLAKTMPGTEKLELVGENVYSGVMRIRVGPVQGEFKGKVELLDLVKPESYRMKVNGSGPSGFVKGEGTIRLENGDQGTTMHYEGDAQVSGRIAQVGQRLMDSSAKAIVAQSLEALDAQVQARMAPVPEPTAPAGDAPAGDTTPQTPAGPSQAQFALGVAQKMAEEYIPKEQQPLLLGGLGVLALLLVVRLIMGWWADILARRIAYHLQKNREE